MFHFAGAKLKPSVSHLSTRGINSLLLFLSEASVFRSRRFRVGKAGKRETRSQRRRYRCEVAVIFGPAIDPRPTAAPGIDSREEPACILHPSTQ